MSLKCKIMRVDKDTIASHHILIFPCQIFIRRQIGQRRDIQDKYTSSYTTSLVNRSLIDIFSIRVGFISVDLIFLKISYLQYFFIEQRNLQQEAYHIYNMASVEDQDIDIRRREDAIAEVKALKGREYGKGITRCCHEEFIKP